MATKKLTKAERLVNEQMLVILEWAADHPKHWHDIGPLPSFKQAAELLAKRGARYERPRIHFGSKRKLII
jgi:hypothetical protein